MAQYTMELREITEDLGIKIFKDYPLFKEEYRLHFEKMIVDNFFFREIGVETVERFIFNLNTRLNLIMPYYNKMYEAMSLDQRILDNYDVTETFERSTSSMGTQNATGENKNLYNETPQGKVDISSFDYVTSLTKDITDNNSTVSNDGSEKWLRTMQGNIGVQTDAMAVVAYIESLRNVDKLVLGELNDLFMLVY